MTLADRIRNIPFDTPSNIVAAALGCHDGYVRAVRARTKNPGRDAAYGRKYYWRDPEPKREKQREREARYRAKKKAQAT